MAGGTEARRYIAIVASETLYEFTKRTTMYVISVAVKCQVKNDDFRNSPKPIA